VRLQGFAAWRMVLAYAADPLACFERAVAEHGPVVRLARSRLGWRGDALLLVGPAYNREVLLAPDRLRPTGIWPVKAPAGSAQANLRANYLTLHGEEHAAFARATAPVLERAAVRAHHAAVGRIAAEEMARWRPGTEADIHALCRDLAQHYAFALIFGEGDGERRRSFGAMLGSYHEANWSWVARLLRLDWPGMPYRRVLREAERLQDFVLRWGTGCPHAGGEASNVRAALACMRDASPARTAAHLVGFGLASYETTAATLTWALVLLATHPEAQAALLAELAAAGPVAAMTPEALAALPALDGVIRETLRLVAPVPFLGFRTVREGELGGEALPAGALVFISPHLTHRLPSLWDEPRRFRPERWREARPGPWDYLPFAGGPRRCPGYLFAENNLRVALATIVPRVKLSLTAPVDRGYAAITSPKGGVRMRIEHQDGKPSASPPAGRFFDMVDVA
jgi:cytochrome P450